MLLAGESLWRQEAVLLVQLGFETLKMRLRVLQDSNFKGRLGVEVTISECYQTGYVFGMRSFCSQMMVMVMKLDFYGMFRV